MSNHFITILVLIAVISIAVASVVFNPKARVWWDQKMTDRKRRRAHDGKVKCEDEEDCDSTATYLTPNGYFCDFHYEPKTVKVLSNGGKEIWAHILYHTQRRG